MAQELDREIHHPQETHLDVRQWIIDVLSWDGLLPIATFFLSLVAANLFQGNQAAETLILISLPIAGVLIRFTMGKQRINTNYCGPRMRIIQFSCLSLALLIYMFFDFFVVLNAIARMNMDFGPGDVTVITLIALAYICLATIAMYPGFRPAPELQTSRPQYQDEPFS